MNLYVQQQYLLAKLLLISSRARPTSAKIFWGQNDDLLQLGNFEYANGMTYTRGVKCTWFGVGINLYLVTFEKKQVLFTSHYHAIFTHLPPKSEK